MRHASIACEKRFLFLTMSADTAKPVVKYCLKLPMQTVYYIRLAVNCLLLNHCIQVDWTVSHAIDRYEGRR